MKLKSNECKKAMSFMEIYFYILKQYQEHRMETAMFQMAYYILRFSFSSY